MALLNSKMVPLGTKAIDFDLCGTDGKNYSLDSFKKKKVLVVIFMCNHCPYVIAVLDRLIAIQNDYEDKGVQLIGINPNDTVNYPEDSFDNMKKKVKEKNIPFPYLIDESQNIARKYDAVCTPDIYVYGNERTLIYRGRIDDNWQEESKVTQRDLRDALDAILKGNPVSGKQTPSMGCSIKWK
tara:strand:+ start:6221 stop:6769 length:549 start_codon:yes stop_codon:yes gene_type:complete